MINSQTTSAAVRGHVQLDRVTIGYGDSPIVPDLSIDIGAGEFICLLGPSGCGKTTTLRAVAGLVRPQSGTIRIDGDLVNNQPAHRRGIAMVFQDLALFPHMSVFENIAFGLTLRRLDADAIRGEVESVVRLLHLGGLQDRLPRQLSGGQQQRVAIARSLVVKPSVLLLDEPFAALDRKLRDEMRREIRALQRRLGITMIFVTHDQEEALTMSDRVVIMNRGIIEQVGTPTDVYEAPASRFVMNFVGQTNFLPAAKAKRHGPDIRCEVAGQEVLLATPPVPGEAEMHGLEFAIRPERIRIDPGATMLPNRIPGKIVDVVYEGAATIYEVEVWSGQSIQVKQTNLGEPAERSKLGRGDRVTLGWGRFDGILVGRLADIPQG